MERYRSRLPEPVGRPTRSGGKGSSGTRAITGRAGAARTRGAGTGNVKTAGTAGKAMPPSRSLRNRAAHRYTRPGVRAVEPARRGGSGIATRGTRTATRGTAPTLVPKRARGAGLSPLLGVNPGYGSGYYGGYHDHYYNHLGLSFCFGFGSYSHHWGFWSYPYYYCRSFPYSYWWSYCYTPTYYGHYTRSYATYYDYWWWPGRRCYVPIAWYGGPRSLYVESDDVTVVTAGGSGYAAGGGDEPPTAESLAALADRYIALGDFYFKEGRFSDAAEAYARARTYAPDDATIHFVLADALFAVGDYHFAAYLIGEAVRLDPTIVLAEADKRDFYGDPELFDEQMETLTEYLAEKPYDAAAHLVHGYNLWFSGRRELAGKAFRRVLEIEPGHSAARAFLEPPEIEAEAEAPPSGEETEKDAGDEEKNEDA